MNSQQTLHNYVTQTTNYQPMVIIPTLDSMVPITTPQFSDPPFDINFFYKFNYLFKLYIIFN